MPVSACVLQEIDADGKPVQPGGGAKGGAGEDDSDDDEDEDDEDMDDDDDDEEEEEDAKPKGGKGSKGDGKGGAKGNAKGDGNGGAKGDGKASGGQDKKRRAEEGGQGATPGGKKAKVTVGVVVVSCGGARSEEGRGDGPVAVVVGTDVKTCLSSLSLTGKRICCINLTNGSLCHGQHASCRALAIAGGRQGQQGCPRSQPRPRSRSWSRSQSL